MNFRVKVLPRAKHDIEDTYHFIATVQQEPLAALRWVDGIERTMQSLSSLAHRGRVIREHELLGTDQELRQILFHKHRIIYSVLDDLVQVVHIRRGSRQDMQEDGDDA
jgi:plasmid stabilization system protein ParE